MNERLSAAAIHFLTATGAAFALLALIAAARGDWQLMFVWLGVALIVDTIDGPLARRVGVTRVLPRWSGERLDLIVANDVSLAGSGFESDFNKVTMLRRDGIETDLPLLLKIDVAHRLWDEALALRGG